MRKLKRYIYFSILLVSLANFFIYKDIFVRYIIKSSNAFKTFIFTDKIKICTLMQQDINSILSKDVNNWSVTVRDSSSNIITDVNGRTMRIPASNLKLYTTAYALDKLGPYYKLRTKIYKNSKGFYEIKGTGDPDLNKTDFISMASIIKSHPYYTYATPKIVIYEENKNLWWPSSWPHSDRNYTYASPITRLAIASNSNTYSLKEPILYFKDNLHKSLKTFNLNYNVDIIDNSNYKKFSKRKLIYSKESAPLYMLLSLANADSHNFTSEVLLRNTAKSWDSSIASLRLSKWLIAKGIDSSFIYIHDGSGLSRKNMTTTHSISHLLYYMSKHKYKDYYISSMSLVGARGTLKDKYISKSTNYKFYGKTGTLTGIRSLSGYLFTPHGKVIVSIISTSLDYSPIYFTDILSSVHKHSSCNS